MAASSWESRGHYCDSDLTVTVVIVSLWDWGEPTSANSRDFILTVLFSCNVSQWAPLQWPTCVFDWLAVPSTCLFAEWGQQTATSTGESETAAGCSPAKSYAGPKAASVSTLCTNSCMLLIEDQKCLSGSVLCMCLLQERVFLCVHTLLIARVRLLAYCPFASLPHSWLYLGLQN